MGSEEEKLVCDPREKTFHIFRAFMTGIAKIDELGKAGSRLLIGFQEALEFLRRPSIDGTSELVDKIIVANETKRVKSYVKAGCRTPHDGAQNVSKLHSCNVGLLDHISKAKVIVNELEGLLEDATDSIQGTLRDLSPVSDPDLGDVELNGEATCNDKEEMALCDSQNNDITHLGTLMATLYSMVKQDYLMQERIISALGPKMSAGELESYCLMWSLRPFINDDIMHQAWRLIP
ncbi:hypothetical protein L6164_020475 [Bauhinia variegata]|uniref:Uncharacterized protein n=1 Tax=Bauhinia variegata TaxID=167791 RepID=A0ACB9MVK1_BAUVA|nr:hypothetical protein L6164_020475 [Bauhinia variegata]